MDKQKQIEEMAKVVRKYYSGFSEYKVVEEIYRILIPDGAVVLTDKKDIQQYEWSKLVDKMGVIEFGEKLCKETAEKFALKLADYFVENCGGRLCLSLTLQEWYKMIDEIRKEITEERKCRDT